MFWYRLGVAWVLLFLAASSVSAFVELSIDRADCIGAGRVSLLVTNRGDEAMGVEKARVHANYFSAFAVDADTRGINKDFALPLPGSWSDDVLSSLEGPVAFTSQDIFTYPGEYRVTVMYERCKPSYPSCAATVRVSCPGVKEYGCKAIPLKIDQCKNVDDTLFITFHNVQKGLLTNVNPYKDIKYIFYGDRYHLDNELPNTTITKVGDDTYLLVMNLTNGNKIDRVKLENRVCGHVEYANCRIEGSGVPRLNATESNGTNPILPLAEKEESVFSKELIYLVAIVFVVVILFIVYHIRARA